MPRRNRIQTHQGFTLIELMIVIAIIAILAIIAIPAYKDYITRARVIEMIAMGSTAKTSVSEYAVSNGKFPKNNAEAGVSEITTHLVKSVTVGGEGVITISGNPTSLGAQLTITLEPKLNAGTVTWACHASGDTQYAPSSCR